MDQVYCVVSQNLNFVKMKDIKIQKRTGGTIDGLNGGMIDGFNSGVWDGSKDIVEW